MSRKIAVLGTGANGASIGADLTAAGEDVVLIEQWPAHVEAMRANGVTVHMPDRSLTVPVRTLHLCEVATLRETFDVVLVLMKAYDTLWASHLIAPYVAEDGLVAGVQNGMTTSAVAAAVGQRRTIGAVIEITSAMWEPGIVERHSDPSRSWFAVGSTSPATQGRDGEIGDLLAHSGAVDVVADIEAAKWMKLVSNATTLVTTAILGTSIAEAAHSPQMREVMLASGGEALAALLAIGKPVLPIFGLGPDDVADTEVLVERLLDTLIDGFVLPGSKSTVLQDWSKGRRSEVGEINGHVARTLQAQGIPAPMNEAVVRIAQDIEQGREKPGTHLLDLLRGAMD